MKRPAIFFDRDNTLIACDEYLGDPSKVELVQGAADAVARARALGFATVTFSNQSGVARGYFDEKAVHAVNQRMDELLAEQNPRAIIDRHEFCPDHPQGTIEAYRKESMRRKPQPGMIYSAADALALDLTRSWVIGDAPRDIEAGRSAGLRAVLFCDPALNRSPAADAEAKAQPDYCVSSLNEALDFIEREVAGIGASKVTPTTVTESEVEVLEPHEPPDVVESPVEPEVSTPVETRSSEGGMLGGADPDPVEPAKPIASETSPAIEEPPAPPAAAPSEYDEQRFEKVLQPIVHNISTAKLEQILGEVLRELRKRNADSHDDDFSVSKLLAGIVQVVVLAVLFLGYLYRHDTQLVAVLIFALTLQTMTIALLIMGKQR